MVQYYSYKPIRIGQELLLFYGDEYFSDLGYDICREDSSNSKLMRSELLKFSIAIEPEINQFVSAENNFCFMVMNISLILVAMYAGMILLMVSH